MTRKVALVTGASRGIGAATAKLLGGLGYAIGVNYRVQAQAAGAVVDAIESAGGEALAIAADIGSEADVMTMFRAIDERWGRLDALVNNAGILETQSRVEELSAARLQRVMNINVVGTFLCCREAVKRMGRGGSIVNVSSVAARLGAAGEYVDYAAAKGAIDTLTIGLAQEVAGRGIRVNAVRPGFIATDIHADGGEPGRVERIGPGLPLGRGGTAEEVAESIAWFVSDKSAFSTGGFLDVAGGR